MGLKGSFRQRQKKISSVETGHGEGRRRGGCSCPASGKMLGNSGLVAAATSACWKHRPVTMCTEAASKQTAALACANLSAGPHQAGKSSGIPFSWHGETPGRSRGPGAGPLGGLAPFAGRQFPNQAQVWGDLIPLSGCGTCPSQA